MSEGDEQGDEEEKDNGSVINGVRSMISNSPYSRANYAEQSEYLDMK